MQKKTIQREGMEQRLPPQAREFQENLEDQSSHPNVCSNVQIPCLRVQLIFYQFFFKLRNDILENLSDAAVSHFLQSHPGLVP